MATTFKLPELGENIETIQVVKVLVAKGDTIEREQAVLELETDKATVEVPSSVSGTIAAIHVSEGDEIEVGAAILDVEDDEGSGDAAAAATEPEAEAEAPDDTSDETSDDTSDAAAAAAEGEGAADASDEPAAGGEASEFKLPELGENIETIQVVKVLVNPGDAVKAEQAVLELETDKATVEVPSNVSGTVDEVRVKAGDDITVGQTIFTVKAGGKKTAGKPAKSAGGASTKADGKAAKPAAAQAKPASVKPAGAPRASDVPMPPSAGRVAAAPSVRRFAREIGIDITHVPGTGPHNRVSVEDVKRYARQGNEGRGAEGATAAAGAGVPMLPPLPDFGKWGEVRREKMSVIRRKTAEHMALSWAQVPHVTIFDTADITEIEGLRKRFAEKAEKAGGKLTMGAMVVKIVAQALRVFPRFNASVDMTGREVIYKDYCNVGVAVDTERGLMVPVIRGTDRKNMIEIAVELATLAGRARAGKIGVDELEGGTFTVTNLGRTCGTFFTPIVNYPEVAILGVGRAFDEPDARGGGLRRKLPLSLSFDHRVIDGSEGVRFLEWVIEALGEPLLLSLEG